MAAPKHNNHTSNYIKAREKFKAEILIARLTKTGGPLTKILSFPGGKLVKDASRCSMARGAIESVAVSSMGELADVLVSLDVNQAVAITNRHFPAGTPLVSKARAKRGEPGITRTLGNLPAERGGMFLVLDHDPDGQPCPLDPAEAVALLERACGAIPGTAAHVVTRSSSAGVIAPDGTPLTGGASFHVWLAIKDGADLARFRKHLEAWLWLQGMGWVMVSKSGARLKRTALDLSVLSTERLVFEASPILRDGLTQLRPDPVVSEGAGLDTSRLDLTTEELAEAASLKSAASRAKAGEAADVSAKYLEASAARLVRETGTTIEAARATVQARQALVLTPGDVLYLDEAGPVTVAQVLADPEAFDGATLADPLEPDYQGAPGSITPDKAVIQFRNGAVTVFSHAHGGQVYTVDATPPEAANDNTRPVNAWSLEPVDVTGKNRAQLLDMLGKSTDPEDAAALCLAVARRFYMTTPVQDTIEGLLATIGAALPAGLVHPATLRSIGARLSAALVHRKAAALDHTRIPASVAAAHNVEHVAALPSLSPTDYKGVIAVRAPMASGKTQTIGRPFIAWAKAAGMSPLAIVHRVSLVHELARTLGLVKYDDLDRVSASVLKADEGVAICLPSITARALAPAVHAARVLFIDEVSQVLRFLSSRDHCKTNDATNEGVYRKLRELVAGAECVIVADAGCDARTIRFLEDCRPGERFRIIEMEHRAEGIEAAHHYGTSAAAAVVSECLVELLDGGRVWIATESNRRSKVLGEFFASQGLKVLAVNADNKGNRAQAAFLADPEGQSRLYDVVIASPVIGSGLSIEHRDGGAHFTLGAFIGGGSRITPADAAQAMRRVRYLRRYVLGLLPNSETGRQSGKSIECAWLEASAAEGVPALPDTFSGLVADIEASDANARADFAAGLLWNLEAAHWTLTRGNSDGEDVAADLTMIRDRLDAEHRAALIASPILSDFEAERLRSQPNRTEADAIALEAARIRRSLGVFELDEATLDFWDGGAAVRRMDRFSAWRGVVAAHDDRNDNPARRRYARAVAAAYARIFAGIDLAGGVRITDELADIALDRIIELRHVAAHLGIVPKSYGVWDERKDGTVLPFKRPKNARQELAEVLRRMGLKWRAVTARVCTPGASPSETKPEGAHKPAAKFGRVYILDQASVDAMQAWADRRNARRATIKALDDMTVGEALEVQRQPGFTGERVIGRVIAFMTRPVIGRLLDTGHAWRRFVDHCAQAA